LPYHYIKGLAGATLAGGLPDAYDAEATGSEDGALFGMDVAIGFMVIRTAFGVTHDNGRRSGVG
jgi:hypothetical protein